MKATNIFRFLPLLAVLALALAACSPKNVPQRTPTAGEMGLEKDYLLVEANKYFLLGDHASALSIINQAVRRDTLCAACYYLRSSIYANVGAYAEALADANRAGAIDSTNRWYTLMRAQLNAQNAKLDEAERLYEKLVVERGYDSEMYYSLAGLYGMSNKLDKAAAALDTVELHEGNSEQLVLARQQLYYRTGETEKALHEAIELNEEQPGNPQYLTIVGDVYARKGELIEARQFYDNALQVDSLYAPAQFGRLEVFRKQESYVPYFTELKKLCANNRLELGEKLNYLSLVISDPTLGTVGTIWLNDILKGMYASYSSVWGFNAFYISYLVQARQPDEAVSVADKYMAAAKPVKNPEAWGLYLSLLNNAQKWGDLAKSSDEAIAQVGKQVPFYMFKSIGLWQVKNIKGAIATLNEALKQKPDTTQRVEVYGFLGDLYELDGSSKKSFKSYEKALDLNPESVVVLNNYAYHLSEKGERLNDALKMAKKVAEKEPNNATYLDTYGWIYYKMGLYSEAKNIFRQVIVYGGRTQSVPLDHYGDVLFALAEYDTAIIYWEFALEAPDCENPDVIKQKIATAKSKSK